MLGKHLSCLFFVVHFYLKERCRLSFQVLEVLLKTRAVSLAVFRFRTYSREQKENTEVCGRRRGGIYLSGNKDHQPGIIQWTQTPPNTISRRKTKTCLDTNYLFKRAASWTTEYFIFRKSKLITEGKFSISEKARREAENFIYSMYIRTFFRWYL